MTDSLRHMGGHFLGPYFYQEWDSFEGSPRDVGRNYASRAGVQEAERMLGIMDVLLHLDIDEVRFADLCQAMGIDHLSDPAPSTHRELIVDARLGILDVLAERALAGLDEDGLV